MNVRQLLKRIDWVNVTFLTSTPLIAAAGTYFLVQHHGVRTPTLVLSLILGVLTGIAVTAGYHRLFAHKSYEAKGLVRFILLFFGAASFENSALRWSSDHRRHHKYVDTDLDPYNIKKGFWYAHIGWICLKYENPDIYNNVTDLEGDSLVQFQDRHYVLLGVLAGFALPMAVASLWGDALGGLLLGGFLRVVLNHHFTFAINSVCHYMGKQPYSDRNSSRDSWIPALFTYGEGYHNYHHTFPTDYRNGIRAYHWDPTKWLIKTLEWVGQASNLRRMPDYTILKARLRMDEQRMIHKIERASAAVNVRREFVVSARLKIEEAYSHVRALKAEYIRLKNEKIDSVSAQWGAFQERLKALKKELRHARQVLQHAIADWAHLCGSLGVRTSSFAFTA